MSGLKHIDGAIGPQLAFLSDRFFRRHASDCSIFDFTEMVEDIFAFGFVVSCTAAKRSRQKRRHPLGNVTGRSKEHQSCIVAKLITAGTKRGCVKGRFGFSWSCRRCLRLTRTPPGASSNSSLNRLFVRHRAARHEWYHHFAL